MKTIKIKISDLKSPERNVRKHNENQIKEFCRSLEMFGQIRPVVIDENNVVYCGNGLVEAARSLGWDEVEALQKKGLSENQKKKLMIVDNRIYSLGFDDYDSINSIIEEIGDFDIPGFDTDTLENMFGNLENELDSFGVLSDDEKKVAARANENKPDESEIKTYKDEATSEYEPEKMDDGGDTEREERHDVEVNSGAEQHNEEVPQKRIIKCPHCGGEICC